MRCQEESGGTVWLALTRAHLDTAPEGSRLERDVYLASSFERPSGNVSPTPIER